jgi:hypothetical protein
LTDTRSARIREDLRRQILSGRLAPGARLPTERQLAVRYAVSATTINKVMTALDLDGLLERRRGTGTYVRPDLTRRATAVVLGPPHAPPGPVFWADLAREAIAWAAKRDGGVRTYLEAGTVPPAETPLAADARVGRLSGALLLGAGAAAARVLEACGIPFVHLAGDGPGPAVRVAWGDSRGDRGGDVPPDALSDHAPPDRAARDDAARNGATRARIDPVQIVQAGFELLMALERANREGITLPAADVVRTVRPRSADT